MLQRIIASLALGPIGICLGNQGGFIKPRFNQQEKLRNIVRIHYDGFYAMQQKHGLDTLLYSLSDPSRILLWLNKNGHLNSNKNFCDPFMSNGLTVHLAQAISGADSTGIELSKLLHSSAVNISFILSSLGIVDKSRIHLLRGDSRRMDLKGYDVFYLYPPFDDGIPNIMLIWDIVSKMKTGAVVAFLTGIDGYFDSEYFRTLNLGRYIEKIGECERNPIYQRK